VDAFFHCRRRLVGGHQQRRLCPGKRQLSRKSPIKARGWRCPWG
jgi:hypothetical protein